MESKQAFESLADRIFNSLAWSKFDAQDKPFLPIDCIESLITKDAIRKELGLDNDSTVTQEQIVDWVYGEARVVFAITVQCDIGLENTLESIGSFRQSNFSNASLPIDNPRTTSLQEWSRHFSDKIWTSPRRYRFWENQWTFLTPVFATDKYNYDLSSECILPFIWKDETVKEGAFSCVYRVRIHPAHQRHEFREVAIKEIRVNRGGDKDGTDREWEREARALDAINGLNHEHIIKCVAAVRMGNNRYFMFPWANGGSLRDFWEATPAQTPNADIICQAVMQLRGLADALFHLHNFEGEVVAQDSEVPAVKIPDVKVQGEEAAVTDEASNQSIRHGDLKPENILRFLSNHTSKDDQTHLGLLKLADMGLAKRHVVSTQDRKCLTSTRYGTIRYEAPEAVTALEGQGRSRLYDIWSMGCITLESIIWILYGNRALDDFYKQLKGESQETQYFEIREDGNVAEVHRVVRQWMDHIQKNDPECTQDSAIRDLLELVKTKLLVVDLSPHRPSLLTGKPGPHLAPPAEGEDKRNYRATAKSFLESLDAIQSKLRDKNYVLTRKRRENVRIPAKLSSSFLSESDARREKISIPSIRVPPEHPVIVDMTRTVRADYTLPPLEAWEFLVDNTFADQVLAQLGRQAMQPRLSMPTTLCDRCKNLNFWTGGFAIEYRVSDLQERSKICDFCRMLWGVCTMHGSAKGFNVRFERIESTLRLSGSQSLPVLSILRSPELKPPLPIQLGFPELLKPGTDIFFQLICLWLQDCDHNHDDCRGPTQTYSPTRLIDVGTSAEPRLLLLETRENKPGDTRYIALSHPWGDSAKHPPFRTLRKDHSGQGRELATFLKGIPYDQLPATFKDAVDTTRALGIRYLWIDSICIIQGDDGDFSEEAKHMEDVFSCAYCVLAASRANGQHDGFLKDRPQREYLTFGHGVESFYVCRPIDDFGRDVLEGSLNKRGWVLQERALARRTVFFTENQTYFECGRGVRCETLAKMHHNMADFLGDPKFPDKAMASPRGLKIRYFQDLYKRYSRLAFSHIEDRPFAIEGVENRLRKAYGTKGGYGIFDDGPGKGLFHRSLLWQRGEDEEPPGLSAIVFPPGRKVSVPTWSWMAYRGGIDYLDPPFEKTDWEKADIHPPWTRYNGETAPAADTIYHKAAVELVATARDYNVAGSRVGEVRIVYDTERDKSDGNRVQCVVVAKSKEEKTDAEKRHYVLIVVPTKLTAAGGDKIYKRVGAGYMVGKYISLGKPGTPVRIR